MASCRQTCSEQTCAGLPATCVRLCHFGPGLLSKAEGQKPAFGLQMIPFLCSPSLAHPSSLMIKGTVQYRACLTLEALSRIFQALFIQSTKLTNLQPISREPAYLMHGPHVAPIKEPNRVMAFPYEVRPQSRLSLPECPSHVIATPTWRQQTVACAVPTPLTPWASLLVPFEVGGKRIKYDVLKQPLLLSPLCVLLLRGCRC